MSRKQIAFPHAIDDATTLYSAQDFATSKLQAELLTNATFIVVAAADKDRFPSSGYFTVLINQEILLVGDRGTSNQLKIIERAINGVPVVVHPVNINVVHVDSALYHETIREALIKVEKEFFYYARPVLSSYPLAVPASPVDGDSYIVTTESKANPAASNPWASVAVNNIATWEQSSLSWRIKKPVKGTHVYDLDLKMTWFAIEDPTDPLPSTDPLKRMIWIPDNYLDSNRVKIVDLLEDLDFLKLRRPVGVDSDSYFKLSNTNVNSGGCHLSVTDDATEKYTMIHGYEGSVSETKPSRFQSAYMPAKQAFDVYDVFAATAAIDAPQTSGRENVIIPDDMMINELEVHFSTVGKFELNVWVTKQGAQNVDLMEEFSLIKVKKTVVAGDLGQPTKIKLKQPVQACKGTVFNIKWSGVTLKGSLVSTVFKPLMKFTGFKVYKHEVVTSREIKWRFINKDTTVENLNIQNMERIAIDNTGLAVDTFIEVFVKLDADTTYFEISDFYGTFKPSQPVKVVIEGTPDDTEYQLTRLNGIYMFQKVANVWHWSIK